MKNIENIKAYKINEVYDIMAKIEVFNVNKLKEIIAFKTQNLSNVRSILTMIVSG